MRAPAPEVHLQPRAEPSPKHYQPFAYGKHHTERIDEVLTPDRKGHATVGVIELWR
jgi:hypothetical protein